MQEYRLKTDIHRLEHEIARLENNPEKKIRPVVSPRTCRPRQYEWWWDRWLRRMGDETPMAIIRPNDAWRYTWNKDSFNEMPAKKSCYEATYSREAILTKQHISSIKRCCLNMQIYYAWHMQLDCSMIYECRYRMYSVLPEGVVN